MKVRIEYCSLWNYEPKAVSLAAKLLVEYKQKIATLELVPLGGGCFEIDVDGKRIYSKLETESFPDEDEIVKRLGS